MESVTEGDTQREKVRDTDRETEGDTQRESERDTDTERERMDSKTEGETRKEGGRDRERMETVTETEGDTQMERVGDTDTERERIETEGDTDRDTERMESETERDAQCVWMEGNVVQTLRALGSPGPLVEEGMLCQAASEGPCSLHFTALCSWLASELKSISPLEECITPTTGPEDSETFQLEASGLVNELRCPYPSLTTGDVTSRLNNRESCLQLLLFLGSELLAARILHARKPLAQCQVPRDAGDGDYNEILKELQPLCRTLGMAEPTQDTPVPQLFRDLETKENLKEIHRALSVEYMCRRQMLITRLDVTVQSFHWAEGAQQHGAVMRQLYQPLREALSARSSITLAHLLSAREDLSVITKTTSESSRERTACPVNKVLMGPVPDRGGRPGEIEAPMPSWEDRRRGGSAGGRKQKWRGKGRKHK
ncbi:protein FAM98A-like isoform X2 [Hemiscyllium ocellatum]|uniref:protein FAM98A-like isoform X2 n=1 Tax=Hemiscyllium ocellatum TaxID=170820 RepID=UPI002966564F|nr:protein FAM98A-like isoform X2 [Hemiscyllium ocellatum]